MVKIGGLHWFVLPWDKNYDKYARSNTKKIKKAVTSTPKKKAKPKKKVIRRKRR